MKVLVISGSPKGKGDGYALARQIEEEMKRLGPAEFEYLFLKNADLKLCRGCFVCVTRGEDRCPLQDDREMIEEKINKADGVILVSPCYVSNVSWLMKNFMDRLCYTNHRPRFFRQKLMIVSHAGAGMDKAVQALRLALGSGPEIAAELGILTPPWPLADSVQQKQEKKIQKAVLRFHSAILRDSLRGGIPRRPAFADYLRFRFFKKISADTRNYLEADYDYYRCRENYYYEVPINPVTRTAAAVILRFSMFLMRDLAPRAVDVQAGNV